jgi:hypothetical protein
MNQDDKNDPAATTPQISPEPTPQMAKALTLVENKPQGESQPFYTGKRKQKRAPRIVTGGGADEARAYVAATPLPANRDNPAATDTERVHVAPLIDPRRAQTLRSIRMDPLPAGTPPPLTEGNLGGFPEAPPDPADGPPQSSRSRTLGGRTQRIYGGAAPEPVGEIHAPHPRPASSGPPRTVGGRTQKLPVMTPALAEEAAGRAAFAAAADASAATAETTGRDLQRAQATAHAVDQERARRRRVIVALLLMVLTILVLLVIAMIPRDPRPGEQLAEEAAAPTPTLPAEVPSAAPTPTEVAAAVTADPTATAPTADPTPTPPEPPIPTTEPTAVAPPPKKGKVRTPPRSTSQSSASPSDKPPAQPTTTPSTPPEPKPDDFILRPKQP